MTKFLLDEENTPKKSLLDRVRKPLDARVALVNTTANLVAAEVAAEKEAKADDWEQRMGAEADR